MFPKVELGIGLSGIDGVQMTQASPSPKDRDVKSEMQAIFDAQNKRLAEFRNESSPVKQASIVNGIRNLLDAARLTHPKVEWLDQVYESTVARLSTDEEVATARTVLSDIFSENTRVEPRRIVRSNPVYAQYATVIFSPREVDVILSRFGLTGEGPLTLKETAASLGRGSSERIRQIESHALRKLRHPKNVRKIVEAKVIVEESSHEDQSANSLPINGDVFQAQ